MRPVCRSRAPDRLGRQGSARRGHDGHYEERPGKALDIARLGETLRRPSKAVGVRTGLVAVARPAGSGRAADGSPEIDPGSSVRMGMRLVAVMPACDRAHAARRAPFCGVSAAHMRALMRR